LSCHSIFPDVLKYSANLWRIVFASIEGFLAILVSGRKDDISVWSSRQEPGIARPSISTSSVPWGDVPSLYSTYNLQSHSQPCTQPASSYPAASDHHQFHNSSTDIGAGPTTRSPYPPQSPQSPASTASTHSFILPDHHLHNQFNIFFKLMIMNNNHKHIYILTY
jgi:hypothetical protein